MFAAAAVQPSLCCLRASFFALRLHLSSPFYPVAFRLSIFFDSKALPSLQALDNEGSMPLFNRGF